MNTQQFIGYMQSPAELGKEAGAQLDSLTREFPYFQTAQLLYVKSLHNENSFLYNNQLKLAAAYAADRRVLYELITEKKKEPETVAENSTHTVSIPLPETSAEEKQTAAPGQKTGTSEEKNTPALTAEQILKARLAELAQEWDEGVLRQLQLLRHWQKDSGLSNPFQGTEQEPGAKRNPFRNEEQTEEKKETAPEEAAETKQEASASEKPEEKTAPEPVNAEAEMHQILTVLIEPEEEDVISQETETPVETPIEETEEALTYEITPLTPPETLAVPVVAPEDPVSQEILFKAIGSSIELEVSDELPAVEDLQPKQKEETGEETEKQTQEPVVQEASALSFAQWLKSLNREAQELQTPEVKAEERPGQDDIIEKFIQAEPRITPQKASFYNPVNMARKSVAEDSDMVSETLARIYEQQGNLAKAIRTYQKLSLKYPEKSLYFASLIENLKKTPNKNTK